MAETGLKHILDGYKVLDFTQVLAGPTVTRLMAEMGAEVIKVELTPTGEISRALPFLREGRSAYFIQQNRGKKSLCIDAKHPKGLAILKELVKQVDVVLENFAPGVIGRLGLDYEAVKALNPRVIMCSISAFGQTGPLSKLPGYDYIAQAYSGITSMIGEKDGQPYFPLPGIGDVSTGYMPRQRLTARCYTVSGRGRVNTWISLCSTPTSTVTNSTCKCTLPAMEKLSRPGQAPSIMPSVPAAYTKAVRRICSFWPCPTSGPVYVKPSVGLISSKTHALPIMRPA